MSECRFFDMCETAWDIGCDGSEDTACSLFEPMPDTKALLALADEMDSFSAPLCMDCSISNYCERNDGAFSCADSWVREYAHRIREACGVKK